MIKLHTQSDRLANRSCYPAHCAHKRAYTTRDELYTVLAKYGIRKPVQSSQAANPVNSLADQQKQAIADYLADKRYHVSHGTINKKRASFYDLINTQTGNVNAHCVVWHYFGKQASRTVYINGLKIEQTVYTW